MKSDIYIIGSSNTDMVIKSNSIPKPGETIIGGDFYSFQGGKGANQAVAASKLGGKVIFICKVGDDSLGNKSIKEYESPIDKTLSFHACNLLPLLKGTDLHTSGLTPYCFLQWDLNSWMALYGLIKLLE